MENLPNSKLLSELILLELNCSATEEQSIQLKQILEKHPGAIDYYVEFMMLYSGLSQPGEVAFLEDDAEKERMDFDLLFHALAENEKSAVAVEVEKPIESEPVIPIHVNQLKPKRSISKVSIVAAVLSSAAMLLITMLALLVPPPVASLRHSVDAVWDNKTGIIDAGAKLRTGVKTLERGFAEIVFNKGASVVVHSPAKFELQSDNKIFLFSGKLSSRVPPEAVGFTIQTSKASIVDYGTEFGVEAQSDGSIRTHVFNGKVKVDSIISTAAGSEWLETNEAVLVDNSGQLSQKYKAQSRGFVRTLEAVDEWNLLLGTNLIHNPGFELDSPGEFTLEKSIDEQLTNVSIQGWADNAIATVYTYEELSDQFPRPGYDPVPSDRGKNFFVGVNDNEIYQDIDVSALGYLADRGSLSFSLSGWIGGFKEHEDSLVVTASFRDSLGKEISRSNIGPVTPRNRNNKTGFVFMKSVGNVPVGTSSIRVTMTTKRYNGLSDSYADNLELTLTEHFDNNNQL